MKAIRKNVFNFSIAALTSVATAGLMAGTPDQDQTTQDQQQQQQVVQDQVQQQMVQDQVAQSKGLIVKVPVDQNGKEMPAQAEFRLVMEEAEGKDVVSMFKDAKPVQQGVQQDQQLQQDEVVQDDMDDMKEGETENFRRRGHGHGHHHHGYRPGLGFALGTALGAALNPYYYGSYGYYSYGRPYVYPYYGANYYYYRGGRYHPW